MPIKNYPFLCLRAGDTFRPFLPIQIINPHTDRSYKTYGLIDTGADNCAIPAGIADILEHNLQRGESKQIRTGNGITAAYAHTTRIDIFHIDDDSNRVLTIPDTPIDFMPNLHCVLLGVKDFLSQFLLAIDYPQQTFSITFTK